MRRKRKIRRDQKEGDYEMRWRGKRRWKWVVEQIKIKKEDGEEEKKHN